MTKFEEFTLVNKTKILINISKIVSISDSATSRDYKSLIVLDNKTDYYVKETYEDIFSRLHNV